MLINYGRNIEVVQGLYGTAGDCLEKARKGTLPIFPEGKAFFLYSLCGQ
jgi:hypothetical protein